MQRQEQAFYISRINRKEMTVQSVLSSSLIGICRLQIIFGERGTKLEVS